MRAVVISDFDYAKKLSHHFGIPLINTQLYEPFSPELEKFVLSTQNNMEQYIIYLKELNHCLITKIVPNMNRYRNKRLYLPEKARIPFIMDITILYINEHPL